MLKKASLVFVALSCFVFQSAFSSDEPLSEPFENLQTALLFCPEGMSENECKKVKNNEIYHHYLVKDHSKLPPRVQDIAKASVRFISENDDYNFTQKGPCTGTVIRLKKGNKSCGNKLHLFTAGHCMMWKEEGEEEVFFPTKTIIITTSDAVYPSHVLSFLEKPETLYNDCKKFKYKKSSYKECLVDYGNFQSYIGSDQALVPFSSRNLPPSIKPLEIDIEKVASLEEVDTCFKKKSKTGYFSEVFTRGDAITFGLDYENEANLGSKVFQCKVYNDIKVYDDSNKPYEGKPIIYNKCPVVNGFSGTLGYMKCHQKEAFFLNAGEFIHADNKKEAENELPVPYPSKLRNGELWNNNRGLRLNSQFLKFYFERVCEGKV